MLGILFDNIFVLFDGWVRIVIRDPLLANLVLDSYDADFLQRFHRIKIEKFW